ncbi:hypothetical protein [Streptosporangium sp. CA-115845]
MKPGVHAPGGTPLAGELILMLDEKCRAHLAGYDLHYTPADGLKVAHAN